MQKYASNYLPRIDKNVNYQDRLDDLNDHVIDYQYDVIHDVQYQ